MKYILFLLHPSETCFKFQIRFGIECKKYKNKTSYLFPNKYKVWIALKTLLTPYLYIGNFKLVAGILMGFPENVSIAVGCKLKWDGGCLETFVDNKEWRNFISLHLNTCRRSCYYIFQTILFLLAIFDFLFFLLPVVKSWVIHSPPWVNSPCMKRIQLWFILIENSNCISSFVRRLQKA